MSNLKSYINTKELLFRRLVQVSFIASILVFGINLFSVKMDELIMSACFLILFSITWILFKNDKKTISYHLMFWSLILLLCYPIFILGKSYYAIVIFPVASLVYNVVFFKNKKVQWIYFIGLLLLEFFLLASTMHVSLNDIPIQFYAEFVNALTYMICLFFISQFFIINLEKQQGELALAKADIEEKRFELGEKNKVLDKYIESNIQLESFAHMAAHELKAPLRSITGFASLLRRKIKDKLTPDEDDMFKIISSSNRQMHDMVGALNQLGSVSKMTLNPTEFSISELLDEIIFDRQKDIEEKNASIERDLSIPFIVGDRTLLKQLLSNLLGNALKFVTKNTVPQIKVQLKEVGTEFRITVEDNGIGISKEHRDKIFTLFERLNNNSEYSGSGIGLAISKKIVDLHKGKIWVDQSSSGGSIFYISIPKLNTSLES